MEIQIIYSERRRKTISARMKNGVMKVSAPAHIPEEHLQKIVERFRLKFERKNKPAEPGRNEDLARIAERLNRRYFGGRIQINSIKYATNQNSRFGSCNYRRKTIRISHRLANMPFWVRDYVIVHEMAHILEPNHGKSFYGLVSAYPRAERSRGFLLAKGFELEK
jgi:predicted metal-dependent hydrolase